VLRRFGPAGLIDSGIRRDLDLDKIATPLAGLPATRN